MTSSPVASSTRILVVASAALQMDCTARAAMRVKLVREMLRDVLVFIGSKHDCVATATKLVFWRDGGLAGTRTLDQCLKRALLYQLSYQPTRIAFPVFLPAGDRTEVGHHRLDSK